MKVAHIYASKAKLNSGDFMIGIAAKQYVSQMILNRNDIQYQDLDCRDASLYKESNLDVLNSFDAIIVGAGGLLLPDSAANTVSCWQWIIHKDVLRKIKAPIYVVSIGYNLFYGQNMAMQNHTNNIETPQRLIILRENLRELMNVARHFTMRHQDDIEDTLKIVGEEYRSKINLELCPTIWYTSTYWKPQYTVQDAKYVAIEVKDDREWRRYHKISKAAFYEQLEQFVRDCQAKSIPICYMSHDGSKNFYKHLQSKHISIPYLDNSSANESSILNNYKQVKLLLCSAGHSQMMAYGVGIPTISLVSHPKLKRFCEDINNMYFVEINKTFNIYPLLVQYMSVLTANDPKNNQRQDGL
jgi:hypothetical protein